MIEIGNIYSNNSNQEFQIISKVSNNRFICRFIDTGFEVEVGSDAIRKGAIRDRLAPSVYGIGYLGNINTKPDHKREYSIWNKMIARCYNTTNSDYHLYGGNGVSVCERWHCFEFFVEDLPYIDGYDKELFNAGKIELDKDLKQQGLYYKIYSKDTCTFVSREVNIQLAWNKPIVAVSQDEIVYADSITDMMNRIVIDRSQTTLVRRLNSGQPINGYNIYYNPANIVPAKLCKNISKV